MVEGFLDKTTLPTPTWYRDLVLAARDLPPIPEAFPACYQFAGLRFFPYPSWKLNKVPVYPDLIDAAERFLQTKEIDCYKIESTTCWRSTTCLPRLREPHRGAAR